MESAVARAVRFRHVVFPDSVGGYGRALKFAPPRRWSRHDCSQPDHTTRDVPILPAPTPELSADTESFLCGLFAHGGLGMRHYKPETLHRRLPACLRALRATSLAQARTALHRQPHLAWDALAALLIGVTGFFRDAAVFDTLRDVVLPRLLAECGGRRPLRVWSAACSDGAELYSVAILLAELGGFGGPGCELLGTDCRPAALARAAAGAFEPAAVSGTPAALLERHFNFDGTHYNVNRSLRSVVTWRVADALRPADTPPGPWDMVLCRNLVIYLQPAASTTLWGSIAGALRPGGILVTGKAERPLGARGFGLMRPCVYLKGAA